MGAFGHQSGDCRLVAFGGGGGGTRWVSGGSWVGPSVLPSVWVESRRASGALVVVVGWGGPANRSKKCHRFGLKSRFFSRDLVTEDPQFFETLRYRVFEPKNLERTSNYPGYLSDTFTRAQEPFRIIPPKKMSFFLYRAQSP